MSGTRFLEALDRIGYPAAENLDAQSFDWIFDNDALSPFLDWFCDEIQASNVLSSKDLEQYSQLESSREPVLDGEELEKAMQMMAVVNQNQQTDEQIQQDIPRLEEEIRVCNAKKSALIQQRDKLSMHQRAVTGKLSQMDLVLHTAESDYKVCQEQSQTANVQLNASLERLMASVTSLVDVYADNVTLDVTPSGVTAIGVTASGVTPRGGGAFLSSLSLDDYHAAEEKFTQQMTLFTKKQFFEGIAEMVGSGDNDAADYSFLDVSRPDTLLTNERATVIEENCTTLTRIYAHYPKSELLRIGALVSDKGNEAACEFSENFLISMTESSYPREMAQLSNHLKEARSILGVVRADMWQLAEREVPALVHDSATSQVNHVLRGDYQLKLIRQQYFTLKQDQVIEQLIVQRSRNELLTMSLELELRSHRHVHQLLSAVLLELRATARHVAHRQKIMQDPQLSTCRDQRETIDSRDKFISRVYHMLDDETEDDSEQLFSTYSKMADNADKLQQQMSALSASLAASQLSQSGKLSELERQLHACRDQLCTDSTAPSSTEAVLTDGQTSRAARPLVSAAVIRDGIDQLDSVLKKLEQAVVTTIADVEQKKKNLRLDPLQATERQLFVYFHNDPSKLRQALDAVTCKLQAQQIT